jgi:phage-related protein
VSTLTSVDIREVVFVNENQRQGLSGKLAGIDEVRILFDDDTYRVYYLTQFKAAIYVLDAGMKKSAHEREIPKPQIDRLIERKKVAVAHYASNERWFETRMADRLARRAALRVEP